MLEANTVQKNMVGANLFAEKIFSFKSRPNIIYSNGTLQNDSAGLEKGTNFTQLCIHKKMHTTIKKDLQWEMNY